MQFQFSIPPETPIGWVVFFVFAVATASALVFAILETDMQDRLAAKIPKPRWLWLLLSAMIAALFIPALAAAITLLTQIAFGDPAEGQQTSLGTGALIAAILGAPFIIWRTLVAQRQANTQEESLFNEKINAAAADLAARRQVTRVVNEGTDKECILTEWQDDLVTRAAAIDRLEGLANERPDATPRIARQLSIYLRELSIEFPPVKIPKDLARVARRTFVQQIVPARPDMERAAQTLGRLQDIEGSGLLSSDIDLRKTNLQAFDLRSLSFRGAKFSDAS